MSFNKKHTRTICAALVFVVLLSCVFVTSGCSNKAPEISSVRDRIIYLIEGSKQINEIYFGEGLPVYVRDSDLSKESFVYIGQQNKGYEKVMEVSPYLMLDEMKEATQRIYSSAYCEQLFESCFDGVVVDGVTLLEYVEISEWLYQSAARDVLVENERIYLYDTMKIVRPSNDEYINVEIESYLISSPEKIEKERLSFAFEDGDWYLDTPTY